VIIALGVAIAFASGVEPRRLVLLVAAIYLPVVAGALILLVAWRSRQTDGDRPAIFCEGVASELRAGASLRSALAAAATAGGTPMTATTPVTDMAARVGDMFPSLREELRLTVLNAGRSGSDAAPLFDEIGSLALARAEIRREVRTATAPARATALVLGGAPVVYLVNRAVSGSLESTLVTSPQRISAMVGLGLFMLGLTITLLIVWWAGR
jgi:Flp pilus assembly protein TadB